MPWDIYLSTLITLGSGTPYTVDDQRLGGGVNERRFLRNGGRPEQFDFIVPNAWAYRSVDLRAEKAFAIGGTQRVSVAFEGVNIFSFDNFSNYDGFLPTPPNVNPMFSRPQGRPRPRPSAPVRATLLVLTTRALSLPRLTAIGDRRGGRQRRRPTAAAEAGRGAGAAGDGGAVCRRRRVPRRPLAAVVRLLLGAGRSGDRHRPRPVAHRRLALEREPRQGREHRLGRLRPDRHVHRGGARLAAAGGDPRPHARHARDLRDQTGARARLVLPLAERPHRRARVEERGVVDRHGAAARAACSACASASPTMPTSRASRPRSTTASTSTGCATGIRRCSRTAGGPRAA